MNTGGIIYRIIVKLHRIKVNMLWKSQRKMLGKIGPGSSVLELPYIKGYANIQIGAHFHIGKDIRLDAWTKYRDQSFTPKIVIGNNVTMSGRCYLSCIDMIKIGDGVLFGRDVFITDNSHGNSSFDMITIEPAKRQLTTKGPVIIGDCVWIGRQVTILSGVKIGDHSIIGANSVVNKDIPPYCIAVGNPARVIKRVETRSD